LPKFSLSDNYFFASLRSCFHVPLDPPLLCAKQNWKFLSLEK